MGFGTKTLKGNAGKLAGILDVPPDHRQYVGSIMDTGTMKNHVGFCTATEAFGLKEARVPVQDQLISDHAESFLLIK